ncbi:MAG TPA: NEW3 domain-containing protein, partial [Bacillota bacterium]|nr:NEW3 domain-containing protein [Bacillota bacterium]
MRSLMHQERRTIRHPGRWVIKSFSLFAAVVLLTVIFPSWAFAQSGITIGTPYPGVEVRPGETVEFPLKVRNYTAGSQRIEIRVVSVPDNWGWTLEGGGRSVDRVFVDGNSYENIDLKIDIPADAKEGRYQVILEARGTGSSNRLTIDMQIKEDAKRSSEVSVEYPDLEGSPSTAFKFRMDITNNSSQTQSYSLGANVPSGWQASFSPAYSSEKIASISVEPNKNQGLDVNIDPPDLVAAGEYTIPIIAKSAGETLRQ